MLSAAVPGKCIKNYVAQFEEIIRALFYKKGRVKPEIKRVSVKIPRNLKIRFIVVPRPFCLPAQAAKKAWMTMNSFLFYVQGGGRANVTNYKSTS